MDKKTQMIAALESHYKSILDRHSLDINYLLEKGDASSGLDDLIDAIQKYTYVLNQFNFVQRLKEQVVQGES